MLPTWLVLIRVTSWSLLHSKYASLISPYHPSQPKNVDPSSTLLTPPFFPTHIQVVRMCLLAQASQYTHILHPTPCSGTSSVWAPDILTGTVMTLSELTYLLLLLSLCHLCHQENSQSDGFQTEISPYHFCSRPYGPLLCFPVTPRISSIPALQLSDFISY